MKAVILAAGTGTRMLPLTEHTPKPMLPIANKPLLYHIVNSLTDAGITEFIFVVGYKSDIIKDYFGNKTSSGLKIEYREQTIPNGTAGAIGAVRDLIKLDDRFLVVNGDVLMESADLNKIMNSEGDAVLSAQKVSNPEEYGVLNIIGGKVESIIEKPQFPISNLANAGAYLFSKSIFVAISSTNQSVRGEYEITESIQNLINAGGDVKYVSIESESCLDIRYPWQLLDINERLLKNNRTWNMDGYAEPYATIKENVSIGEGTTIRNGAYIMSNVIIGKNCNISPNCYIRPYTSIGDNVTIGSCVEIKNSIIMDNTHIGHLNYIGDSIIGGNCNFGAGTQVANLRHDGKTIRVDIGTQKIDTGRRKLGVIMGDNVHTGVNSTINVGTIIKGGTNIRPGEHVTGRRIDQ